RNTQQDAKKPRIWLCPSVTETVLDASLQPFPDAFGCLRVVIGDHVDLESRAEGPDTPVPLANPDNLQRALAVAGNLLQGALHPFGIWIETLLRTCHCDNLGALRIRSLDDLLEIP